MPTRNAWGVAVRRDDDGLRGDLDRALTAVIEDGRLAEVWRRWMPWLAVPDALNQ